MEAATEKVPTRVSRGETPVERAAEELRAWIEAGARIVALLAPPGAERRRVLALLSRSLEGRFLTRPWSGQGWSLAASRVALASDVRRAAAPTLLVVEEGERLGPDEARVLRALATDPAGAYCAALALEAQGAGDVLGALGPALEVVVLRGVAARPARSARLRWLATATALVAAGISLGLVASLLLPRLAASPQTATPAIPVRVAAPAPAPPLPEVAAPPPETAPPPPAEIAPKRPPVQAMPRPRPRPAPIRPPPLREAAAIAPVPGPGWLVVNAIPRAAISIDGALLGETPIVRHPVAAGRHRVLARFGDGREQEQTVQISGAEVYLMFDGR